MNTFHDLSTEALWDIILEVMYDNDGYTLFADAIDGIEDSEERQEWMPDKYLLESAVRELAERRKGDEA